MKYLKYNLLFLITGFLLFGSAAHAGGAVLSRKGESFTKTFDQSFEIKPFGKVDLRNQFGKIHITSGEGTQVELHVDVLVEASNEEKAQKKLDKISIDWSSAEDWVKIETKVGRDNKALEKIEINYTVKLPKTCTLNVNHKFGDVYLSGMDGKTSIKLSYGNLQAGRLLALDNDLEIDFSNADVELMAGGKLALRYAESVQIQRAVNLDVNSRFSKLTIGNLKKLILDSQYDKLEIGEVESLEADNQFSHLRVGVVINSLIADHRYGSLKVRKISKDFKKLDVDTDFSNVNLSFESGVAPIVKVKVSYGEADFPDSWGIKRKGDDRLTKSYEGTVGNGSSTISIEVSYGNLEIKEM